MSDKTSSKPAHLTSSGRATSMADLMAGYKKPMQSLTKGDLVEGIVTKLTPSEVLVDINAKTDAVVLEKDKRLLRTLLGTLKVGDKVTVSVLNAESDLGYPVVSLRRFMGDTSWKHLEQLQKAQEKIEVTITDVTRGGYVVATTEGVSGFLPNSHTSFTIPEGEQAAELVGKKVGAYVLELSRSANKVIFSQKEILKAEDFTKAIATLKKGEKVSVVVTNTASFGVFVAVSVHSGDASSSERAEKIRKLDGLIHISEISWEKTTDLAGMFEVGQTLEAVVIGFDKDGKRVDLSIKRLTEDPFEAIASKFAVDQQISGKVIAVGAQGVDVEVEGGAAGFIRKEKIPPTVTFKEGDSVKATIASIDKKKQRLMLIPVLAVKPLGYR